MNFILSPIAIENGYQVKWFECLESTNHLAIDLAKTYKCDRHWIVADEQTSGRARRGRDWSSPKGNLYASLLLIKDIHPNTAAQLGFVAGVSLADAITKCLYEHNLDTNIVRLKWPNDVLLCDDKSAGILLELVQLSQYEYALIIGIGLNVAFNYKLAPYPTQSLKSIGVTTTCQTIFSYLSEFWVQNYYLFLQPDGAVAIRNKWLSYAARLGKRIKILNGNEIIEGDFEGLDHDFNCLVNIGEPQSKKITAGDVFFGGAASLKR
ncbi:biotin--[acetyl-CoA-carboxylase] ligase [Bartonella tamiae]|uniref:biotin--[biotin carboxyl-carrier protein] ligase n=1 Tax=Bartonella tamiae Th239 TaxID=1094558 RepID=J0QS77_9HYPH|nr:biotin--[acetyl-CoA-carboxylase] ligase [Bartonella tamiae]EJF88721.1 biotin-[acetyl-CoA-carboxylase] ligase [Bartonella tamiae Th239]EJF95029.1 biotin-[acetyl-CoA-carboxylase] ligase [Bartonella tamiae Th307]